MTLRIHPSEIICGLPALEARERLREMANGCWRTGERAESWAALEDRFVQQGYLESVEGSLALSRKGAEFVRGKARPGFSRKTCAKALEGVLARAADINSNPRRGPFVESVIVFGSFLGDKEVLGDLDLMIHWKDRYPFDVREALTAERRRVGWFLNKQIDLVDYYQWDWIEAHRYLKGRGPVIGMEPFNQAFLSKIPHRVISAPAPSVVDAAGLFHERHPRITAFSGTAWAVRDQIMALLAGVISGLQASQNAYIFGAFEEDGFTSHLLGDDRSWTSSWNGRGWTSHPFGIAWTKSGQKGFLAGEGRFPFWCVGPSAAADEQVARDLLAAFRAAGVPDAFIEWTGAVGDPILIGPPPTVAH